MGKMLNKIKYKGLGLKIRQDNLNMKDKRERMLKDYVLSSDKAQYLHNVGKYDESIKEHKKTMRLLKKYHKEVHKNLKG